MPRHVARTTVLVAGLAVAVMASPASAQSALRGPGLAPAPAESPLLPQPVPVATPRAPIDDRIAFNTAETWRIAHYFTQVREKQKRSSRSKKFPRALPEGITTDPAKGDRLPLDVLARLDRLPGPLLRELPPRRPDTDRVVVGKNVLMVRSSTGEVLDILPDILH